VNYIYRWGNNKIRAKLKGKICQVLARGSMNSALVQFNNGEQYVVSRNALRRERRET